MQGSDGGWGAYDKDNNRVVFNYIPFADHKALLDPSTSDLAGRCLEMLGALGYDKTHPVAGPAIGVSQERAGERMAVGTDAGVSIISTDVVCLSRTQGHRRRSLGAVYSSSGCLVGIETES